MDNGAKSQAGLPSAFDAIAKTQTASDQQYTSQQNQQMTNSDPSNSFDDYFQGQSNTPLQQPLQNNQQQTPVSSSGRPAEQVPSAIAQMDEDDKDDRIQAPKQEATDQKAPIQEMPTPTAQPSHPEIAIKKELSEMVKPGPDAEREKLPEEPEQLGDTPNQTQPQQTTEQINEDALPMTYGEAMLAKRKEKSIKKGVSWIVRTIIKEWKKKFSNTGKQKLEEQTTINK